MTPPGTFERVYSAIKQRLREGAYSPGSRLEPALLADELNASVTPVRDALHRLTGERLVEAPRHEGFRVPMMTETLLRQLYGWHRDLLLLAVLNHHSTAIADQIGAEGGHSNDLAHERQNALFSALAQSTGNPEHVVAVQSLTDRLQPVQRIEEILLKETGEETTAILNALQAHDRKLLRSALVQYHRRRQRIVPELIAKLLSSSRES